MRRLMYSRKEISENTKCTLEIQTNQLEVISKEMLLTFE